MSCGPTYLMAMEQCAVVAMKQSGVFCSSFRLTKGRAHCKLRAPSARRWVGADNGGAVRVCLCAGVSLCGGRRQRRGTARQEGNGTHAAHSIWGRREGRSARQAPGKEGELCNGWLAAIGSLVATPLKATVPQTLHR